MPAAPHSPLHPELHARAWLILAAIFSVLPACSAPPGYLDDADAISVGSRVEFWVDDDDHGWVRSNIHIACLPRPMTGAEARRWAEGVGNRDSGAHWTRYYLLVTHPEPPHRTYRTAVFTVRARPYEMTGRLPGGV
jgi:hypothetical protein